MTAAHFQGDCGTYFRQGTAWLNGQVPYRDYVVEYPPAAVGVFAALAAVGGYPAFRVVFVLLALALDTASFALVVHQTGRQGGWLAPLTYLVATALLFPVLYVRFDLLPAAATLLACWLLQPMFDPAAPAPRPGRVAAGGAFFGLGVAWKLYPLLLVPFLLLTASRGLRQARQVASMAGVAVLVLGLTFLPVLFAGAWGAIFSFLQYQGERGLQIESSYASVLLVGQALFPLGVYHHPSHHAHDLAGPLAAAIVPWTRPLQLVAVLLVSLVAHRRRLSLARAAAAILAVALATANVLSPQFLIWLVPLAALSLASGLGRGDRATAWLLVAAAGLTPLIFPLLYPRLLEGELVAAVPLLVRNVLLGVLAVRLCARTDHR